MEIKKVKEYKLKGPPTALCAAFGCLYVATKGKRVFFLRSGESVFKSILFSSQVDALGASDTTLYCGCSDGKIFGLASTHKITFRAASDSSGVTHCVFDRAHASLLVSTAGKKVQAFGENSILGNTFYCYDTPVIGFDVSGGGALACVSQNNRSIKVFGADSKELKPLRTAAGFPEALVFVTDERILVGSLSGTLRLYSVRTREVLCTARAPGGIHSLYVQNDIVLAGLGNSALALYRISGNEIVDAGGCAMPGIPVAFCQCEDGIAIAASREPRLGRWGVQKAGHNKVVIARIENAGV